MPWLKLLHVSRKEPSVAIIIVSWRFLVCGDVMRHTTCHAIENVTVESAGSTNGMGVSMHRVHKITTRQHNENVFMGISVLQFRNWCHHTPFKIWNISFLWKLHYFSYKMTSPLHSSSLNGSHIFFPCETIGAGQEVTLWTRSRDLWHRGVFHEIFNSVGFKSNYFIYIHYIHKLRICGYQTLFYIAYLVDSVCLGWSDRFLSLKVLCTRPLEFIVTCNHVGHGTIPLMIFARNWNEIENLCVQQQQSKVSCAKSCSGCCIKVLMITDCHVYQYELWWKSRRWNSDHFVYAPGQWETALQCNAVSHWLVAYTKWSLVKWVNVPYELLGIL